MLATRLLLQCRCGEWRNGALLARPLTAIHDDRVGTIESSDRRCCYLWIELKDLPLLADEGGGDDQVGSGGWANPNFNGGVMTRDKGADDALALHNEAECHRLHPPRRELRLDESREERRKAIADEAIQDAARLLSVNKIQVDRAGVGKRLEDGPLGDLAEGNPASVRLGDAEGLRHMPGNRLPLTVKVGCQPDGGCLLCGTSDVIEALLLIFNNLVDRGEAVLHVHRHAPLLRLLGEIPNVPIGGEHGVVGAEIPLNRLGLGRRLDDNEVGGSLCHGRERSTAPRTRRQRPPRCSISPRRLKRVRAATSAPGNSRERSLRSPSTTPSAPAASTLWRISRCKPEASPPTALVATEATSGGSAK